MANEIPSRCNWFSQLGSSILQDKSKLIDHYIKLLFQRSIMMFDYEGLPETIPKIDLELIKQTYGSVTIAKADNGKLYALYGGLGGVLNEYYHPTISVVSNPYLKLSKTFTIGVDCVVIKNDIFYEGLYTFNRKYAELLAECDISIRKCLVNIRIDNYVVSHDDDTKESIEKYFESVEKGKLAFIGTKKFLDESLIQIHAIASHSNNPLKDLIEMQNFIISSWYIDLGLNANYNMKRESLTDAETNADDKTLIPFIEQMKMCAMDGVKDMNKMFNTNVSVKFSKVWQKVYDEVVNKPITNDESNNDTSDNKDGDDNENNI